jgi:hypothetical protein
VAPRKSKGLLNQIEGDLLSEKPIAGLLRKLLLLGGQVRSKELRDWASSELRGYSPDDDLPPYRSVPATIQMDGMTAYASVKGQRLGVSELPDFAAEHISERVQLPQGVGEIEALARHALGGDQSVKLSLPGSRELARFMEQDAGGGIHIDSIYWRVSTVAIEGVLDQIRTRLVELMAEMRSLTPSSQEIPDPEQAAAAVNVVLRGKNHRVVINTINGAANSTNRIAVAPDGERESEFWTTSRRIGAAAVGIATIAGVVVGILELQ